MDEFLDCLLWLIFFLSGVGVGSAITTFCLLGF